MINNITQEIIWNGRQSGGTWFHPRATALPGGTVLMTCQNIDGSDNFGQAHWSQTDNVGRSWSSPEPIAAFQRQAIGDGFEEGVCDIVPEYHAPTGTVLAMGHNVYYKDGVFVRREGRHSVYAVRDENKNWSMRRKLEWDSPLGTGYQMCGCAQRYTFENGDVLVPLTFAPLGRPDRSVTTVRFAFDGEILSIQEVGTTLSLPVNRGLLEPSIKRFDKVFYLTIRAEDGHGYVTTSLDGLSWNDITPWTFDDGEVLEMSTTQQRWLTHKKKPYLVYTRKTSDNDDVMRWRAPLLVSQVNTTTKQLMRETERIVFPMLGDGMKAENDVARMGNFHTTAISLEESWVTVGEELPQNDWNGDTLLARIN